MSRQPAYRLLERATEFAPQRRREILIGLAQAVGAKLADGTYDPAFAEVLSGIAGKDLQGHAGPGIADLRTPRFV